MSIRTHVAANDRERLGQAFAELSERGYLTLGAPWDLCCTSCGWREVLKRLDADDLPDDLRTVWWHEQSDSYAFTGDPGTIPQTPGFFDGMPDEADEDEANAWFEAHMEEAIADSVAARLYTYNSLVAPLYVHWRGDAKEIAAALRATGLRVAVPRDESKCFEVRPAKSTFQVHSVDGEVMVHLDGDSVQLSAVDARRLARALNRSAREAAEKSVDLTK